MTDIRSSRRSEGRYLDTIGLMLRTNEHHCELWCDFYGKIQLCQSGGWLGSVGKEPNLPGMGHEPAGIALQPPQLTLQVRCWLLAFGVT